MSIHVFDYGQTDPPLVKREEDGTYSMAFPLSGESLRITHLTRTSLTNIKKAINETLRGERKP